MTNKSLPLRELWDNWDEMPLSERIARIIALTAAPRGLNSLTKSWIDDNHKAYEHFAGAIIEETKK